MTQRPSPAARMLAGTSSPCPHFHPPLLWSVLSTVVIVNLQNISSEQSRGSHLILSGSPDPYNGQRTSTLSLAHPPHHPSLSSLLPLSSSLAPPQPLLCSHLRALALALTSARHALPCNICSAHSVTSFK